MSTVNKSRKSSMTSKAYDLLDCFVSGLDDVIYEVAEQLAVEKGRVEKGVVEITHEEVQEAADIVFRAIREQAGKSISEEVARRIQEMHEYAMEKCKEYKADV